MEHLADVCPFVQILDAPVPQPVDYVMDTLRILDLPMAVQVTEVPKFSCSPCPSRSLIPEPQSAEQLVEVPTVLSPLRIAEQMVGTPVSSWSWQAACSRSSPRTEFNSGAFCGKRISERIVEQIVDISPGGGLRQVLASSAGAADEDLTGFFRTFPMEKSAECRAGGECAAGWARQLYPR